jgi:hypothetical protein
MSQHTYDPKENRIIYHIPDNELQELNQMMQKHPEDDPEIQEMIELANKEKIGFIPVEVNSFLDSTGADCLKGLESNYPNLAAECRTMLRNLVPHECKKEDPFSYQLLRAHVVSGFINQKYYAARLNGKPFILS